MNKELLELFTEKLLERVRMENVGTQIVIATVETPPPNITLNYSGLVIPTNQIEVPCRLLPNYHRTFKSKGVINAMSQTAEIDIKFTGGNTDKGGDGHTHPLLTGKGDGKINTSEGTFDKTGDIWLTDTLIKGTRVTVALIDGSWVILDHIVKMPNEAEEGA